MNHFEYRNGELHAEAVALTRIAEAVGTPFYCYSTATLERHYRRFAGAFAGLDALVCYALKANSNLAVVRTLGDLGAGADVVSEGELRRALAAGVPAARCVFSGVGKTAAEMAFALEAGILQFNVESEPELDLLARIAADRGQRAPVAIRVNPDVAADTHHKIATGRREDKFGIDWDRVRPLYAHAASLPGIEIAGLAVHIGSQLLDLAPFRDAFRRVAGLVRDLRADGHAIRRLDLGGGLGVPYDGEEPPTPEAYAALVGETTEGLDCQIVLEPGRVLTGNAGVLVTRVLYVKQGAERRFAIVDAAMNDLLRPSLYHAHHAIAPVRAPADGAPGEEIDIVGPICETGDTFATRRPMPPLATGDLIVLRTAGAYGATMASEYNSRPLIAEVLVKDDAFAIVRPRPTYDEMLARDRLPPWMAAAPPTRSRGAA